MALKTTEHITDDSQKPFDDLESESYTTNTGTEETSSSSSTGGSLSESDKQTLKHFKYSPVSARLEADVPVETATRDSLFIGETKKIVSGVNFVYTTDLETGNSYYNAKGGLKDQSILANQDESGLIPPYVPVHGAYSVFPSGGNPIAGSSAPYDAPSFYPNNISGLSIGVVLAENIDPSTRLLYNISVNDEPQYEQELEHNGLSIGEFKEWFFRHPLSVLGGSTNRARIRKADADGNILGVLMVEMGDNGENRYHVSVGSRSFEEKTMAFTEDLESLDVVGFYDVYVDPSFSGDSDGTNLRPYKTIQEAVSASSVNDKIFVKGSNTITSPVNLPHSLHFYGIDGSEIRRNYNASDGDLLSYNGLGHFEDFTFKNIKFFGAGEYGLKIIGARYLAIEDCEFINNGHSGFGINTIVSESVSGVAGYDSSQADLQSFYAGVHASSGGAMRIENCTSVRIIGNVVSGNLRAIRIQDCGINGYGFITRNVSSKNIESGIYLAAGSLGGCQNITVSMNASSYNANDGLLCIGGINNVFSQNEVKGNWNAGACAWGAANFTLRDCALYDNNRSQYNGIGNVGARASIQINDAYNILGTQITYNPDFRFIAEILDTQVHYTGLGSSTDKTGVLVSSNVGLLSENDKNIIKIDDVGFISQDNAIDLSEVSTDNLKVILGDNSFINITENNIKEPVSGYYYELPFSNHITNLKQADFKVLNTGNIIIKEGAAGKTLNPYKVNDLQAIAKGSDIAVVLKDSRKIQFTVPVSGASITDENGNSNFVNSVLNQALIELNSLFTNTSGFSSGGNPVVDWLLVDNDLSLVLQDGTSFTHDVTTFGVDENTFVANTGHTTSGTDLILMMNDSTTRTVSLQNIINGSTLSALGQGYFISYGSNAGTEITNPISDSTLFNNAPAYFGEKLKVGHEFVWTQYHLIANPAYYMSIGIWSGATDGSGTATSTAVTNWSTKIGFYSNTITEDTSTLVNGGYSSKNTDVGAGVTYANGAIMRLVYGADYRLRLYADDVLIATTIVAETGNDLDIQLTSSNNGIELPSFINRSSNWGIVHDYDDSELGILDGIEAKTAIETNIEINLGEKLMLDLNRAGLNERIGFDWTGASSAVSNGNSNVTKALIYGTSEQIIPQNANEWDFNTASPYYSSTGNGKWTLGGSTPIGMVSFIYNPDNTVDLYSETHKERIASLSMPLDGLPFKIVLLASSNMAASDIPSASKQTIGQGFQPVTSFKPDISDQSYDITGDLAFNIPIQLNEGSNKANHFVIVSDEWDFTVIDQSNGVLTGTAPPSITGSDSYNIYCKASNSTGGVTNFIVTLNVVASTYTNTKSLQFSSGANSYLTGNPLGMPMLRNGNGTGSSDAWNISFWYKKSADTSVQDIFYYGAKDGVNNGYIKVSQVLGNKIKFHLGTDSDYLSLTTSGNSGGSNLSNGWHFVSINYRGNPTGSSGTPLNFYADFNLSIFFDGVFQPSGVLSGGEGFSGSILPELYLIGKSPDGNYGKGYRINQLAVYGFDMIGADFSDLVTLYNGGVQEDLRTSTFTPENYYEIENSITLIRDLIGDKHLTGWGFSGSDLVTDKP